MRVESYTERGEEDGEEYIAAGIRWIAEDEDDEAIIERMAASAEMAARPYMEH